MNNKADQAIVAYWGAHHLTRWDEQVLRPVDMPLSSKRFLAEVGLPSPGRDIHGWGFEWDLALPPLDVERKDGDQRQMRILGRDRGYDPILIDESRGGCIVFDERHVNASVEQFARSLVEVDKFREDAIRRADEPLDRADVRRRLTALQRRLKRIDETAMANRESLWFAEVITDLRMQMT